MQRIHVPTTWTGVTAYMHGGRQLKALGVPKPYAEVMKFMTEKQKQEWRDHNAAAQARYQKSHGVVVTCSCGKTRTIRLKTMYTQRSQGRTYTCRTCLSKGI